MKNTNNDRLDITDLMYDGTYETAFPLLLKMASHGFAEIIYNGEEDMKILASRDQIDSFLELADECFMDDGEIFYERPTN